MGPDPMMRILCSDSSLGMAGVTFLFIRRKPPAQSDDYPAT